jgi:hypothetical protein
MQSLRPVEHALDHADGFSWRATGPALPAVLFAVFLSGAALSEPAYPRLPIAPAGAVLDDDSFDEFRSTARAALAADDAAALQALFADEIFWERDSGLPEERQESPRERLIAKFGLLGDSLPVEKEFGFRDLQDFLATEKAVAHGPEDYCLPGEWRPLSAADAEGVEALDPGSPLGMVRGRDVPLLDRASASGKTILKLSEEAVRVQYWPPYSCGCAADDAPDRLSWAEVIAPSGAVGQVDRRQVSPRGAPQLCFRKIDGSWRISGYLDVGE